MFVLMPMHISSTFLSTLAKNVHNRHIKIIFLKLYTYVHAHCEPNLKSSLFTSR